MCGAIRTLERCNKSDSRSIQNPRNKNSPVAVMTVVMCIVFRAANISNSYWVILGVDGFDCKKICSHAMLGQELAHCAAD